MACSFFLPSGSSFCIAAVGQVRMDKSINESLSKSSSITSANCVGLFVLAGTRTELKAMQPNDGVFAC